LVKEKFDPKWEEKIGNEEKLKEAMLKAAPATKGKGKSRNETLDIELVK